MSATTPDSFITRVRDVIGGLSVSERRLAELVLDFPGDVASYTATELARLANVSNATVTRFVRHLGYASYEEARRQARAERTSGSPLFLSASPGSRIGSIDSHVMQGQADLAATFRRYAESDIDSAARSIIAARRVVLVGHRASHSLAAYLRWQILQVVEGITAVPGAGETLAEHVAGLTGGDVVVAFALRRRTKAMRPALAHALAAGATVILITNDTMSHALPATRIFWCETAAPGPLDNHVAVLALCHLIATRVIELSGTKGRRRLAAVEAAHASLSELDVTGSA